MALRPIPSPSSGGSHSPSPELPSDGTSANTSPASSATPLHAPPASDEGEPSSSSTPTRAMSDLTRSSSAGKGGCWTCRVRRKKCDEEREGDSCKTCLRLRIKCLGWGPKRPDWMRDKDKVAAYKASIKEQLSRMGLIRGQPRQPWHSAGLSTSSQPSPPSVAGPGPQTTLRGSMSERETTFRRDPPYVARGAGAPYHVPRMTRPISEADQWGGHNISASSSPRHHQVSPMAPLLPTPPTHDSLYGFQSPPLSMGAGDDIPYGTYIPQQGHPQQGMPISMPPPVPAAPPQPTVRKDEYISYYFKYVRELQYVFAGESLANLLLPVSVPGQPTVQYSDIFASITLMQPPRFLSLYKRLFGGGAGFWASRGMSPRSSAQHSELHMDALSGCPDEALLAIAEISALAHWKATELQSGSLSMRELIRRGDAIERELRERATGKSTDSVEDVKPAIIASPSSLAAGLDVPAGMAMAPSPQPGMLGGLRSTRSSIDITKHIIGEMFREAALLYLHTVLSDSVPGVPEIMNGIDQMAKLLNELAPSSYDRTVIFPLFLTGCLTDNQMMREVIKHRFFMQDATNGNVLLAQTVMDEVWAQRTHAVRTARQGDHPRVTDWRQHLRLQWASLLLA